MRGTRRVILPSPLLFFAGAVALVPLAAVVRRPPSAPRLAMETCAVAVAVIAAVCAGWALLWPLEQR